MEHRKIHGFPTKWSKLKLRRDRNKCRQLPSCQEHLSPRTSLHRCSSLGCLSSLVTLKMTGLPWVKHTKRWGIPMNPWTKNLQIMFFFSCFFPHLYVHRWIFINQIYWSIKQQLISKSSWPLTITNQPGCITLNSWPPPGSKICGCP